MKFIVEEYDSLTSTQDLLKTRAIDGVEEGLVIQAHAQDAGRGRHGRQWVSEPGNLYISILLRPNCDVSEIGRISLLTAVALAESISSSDIQLKWPNDVLCQGRKCAGILLESDLNGAHVNWVAVGVGVNTANAPAEGIALHLNAQAFRDTFFQGFAALYMLPFEDIREKWLKHSFDPGTKMSVKIGDCLESGSFHDIDAHGNLLLDTADGLKTITAGDVYIQSCHPVTRPQDPVQEEIGPVVTPRDDESRKNVTGH